MLWLQYFDYVPSYYGILFYLFLAMLAPEIIYDLRTNLMYCNKLYILYYFMINEYKTAL